MGISYQDIETRLNVVEDKLHFIMTALKMRGIVSNGLVGPDGRPAGQPVEQTLLEWYRLVKQAVIEVQSAPDEKSEHLNG